MDSSAKSWLEVLASAGVIALVGRGCEALFRWFVRRPLEREERKRERAEREADHWRARYAEVAGELKANTTALLRAERADKLARGAPSDSLPPMRDEMPTLQCFVDGPPARAWAEERERVAVASVRVPQRVVETYAPDARPTDPAPSGYPKGAPLRPPRPRSR
jgi:hypothetical protein